MEEKNRIELVSTISSSLPIWSFFLGSALSVVIGAALLVLPDVLRSFGIALVEFKQWTLCLAGIVWIFLCGFYLLCFAPIKEIYRIRAMLKNYVRRSDCNGCADIQNELLQVCSDLKAENARLRAIIGGAPNVKIEVKERNNNENKGSQHA